MAFFVQSTRSSTAVGPVVVLKISEEERLQEATNELLRFFHLPLPEEERELEKKKVSTKEEPKKPWRHSLKTNKLKKVHWKDRDTARSQPIITSADPPVQPAKKPPYPLPPPPHTWPQRPLFIRPTPGSSTQIVDIRPADHSFSEENASVPINTGTELPGESIVVDFVSDQFVGSLLLRIKGVPSSQSTNNQSSYFRNRQRTFQGVVRGRFRHSTPLLDCVTGQTFRRPAGTLPALWIVRLFQKLIQRLAPHNQLELEGDAPRSLSPLVTTAQTIQVHHSSTSSSSDQEDQGCMIHDGHFFYDSAYDHHNDCYARNTCQRMEQDWQEPHATHHTSLVYHVANSKDAAHKAPSDLEDAKRNQQFRKRFFNALLDDDRGNQYSFDTSKDYTFEFYEHLVVFDDPEMGLDLRVPLLRHIPIAPCTDGQPIQFMSAVRKENEEEDDLEYLWSFEVWHESLYPYAVRAMEEEEEE